MGHPLAAGAFTLLALSAGHGLAHRGGDAVLGSDRDLRFHAALPKSEPAIAIRRVHGPPDTVLVGAHVGIGHADRVDVGIGERRIPAARVGNAVDVVPAPGVEAHEVRAQRRPNLHQLERGLELLHQDVGLDRPGDQSEVRLQRVQHSSPQRRLLGRLDLGQVEHDGPSFRAEDGLVAHHVQHEVDDRRREPGAVDPADVTIIEVQPAGAEDPGGERELLAPVADDRPAEEALRPAVHLAGNLLGDAQERGITGERQPEVSLVVERHRLGLAECILAVEHPAVGPRQQRVGHVPETRLERGSGPGRRSSALDPLPLQVRRDVAAREVPGPGVADQQARSGDRGVRIEEPDRLPIARSLATPADARGHQLATLQVQRRHRLQGVEHGRRQDVVVGTQEVIADVKGSEHGALHGMVGGVRRDGRPSGRQASAALTRAGPGVRRDWRSVVLVVANAVLGAGALRGFGARMRLWRPGKPRPDGRPGHDRPAGYLDALREQVGAGASGFGKLVHEGPPWGAADPATGMTISQIT